LSRFCDKTGDFRLLGVCSTATPVDSHHASIAIAVFSLYIAHCARHWPVQDS